MGVAGLLWGGATLRERAATCEGRWQAAEEGARAAIVRLSDPAPDSGGPVAADVVAGACGGALRLRWPDGIPAAGGTTWVVAGRWVGSYDRGVLVVRRAKLLDGEPRGRGALRGRLAARSAALFGRRAPLVDALVFAPNAALDPDVRERYARSGLAHILSISGLHVGFLAAWLALILRNLGLSARHRLLASGVVLLGYLWLLGFPAPAARATVMLVVDDVARLRQRVAAPRGVIAVSTLAVLLVDPQALHSVGAWLSVTAIAAVVWAGRATRRSHWGVRAVAPAAAATLLTAPITAFAFGTVAPIGVLANLIAIPLVAIVVPGLVISLALSWLVSGLAALLAAGSGVGLVLPDPIARAAVLRTPTGRWVAIDGGPRIPGIDAGRRVVIPFLRRHGARRVTLVVATHGDADHLGGLPAVVEDFAPELVLEPGEPLGRPLYLEFLAAVEGSGARWHPARAGDRIEVDGVVLEVLSPDSVWMTLPLDVNEHGVVLRVTFGGTHLLFQADAGLPVEGHLAGRVGRVELLKVGHHGSLSATSDAWLGELRPRQAVISVGAHNHYGHPAPEVLGRLRRWGSEIFRTDQVGTITFTTDGQRAYIDLRHHD